jgi:hypothetical protein
MPRRAARVDGNQVAIVELARAYGWLVESLAPLGKGKPDLLCWKAQRGFLLVEVKNVKDRGNKPTKEAQARFASLWPVVRVHSEQEARVVFGGNS